MVAEILRDQMRRDDGGNGVEFVMLMHKQMQIDARSNLFGDLDVQQMKGSRIRRVAFSRYATRVVPLLGEQIAKQAQVRRMIVNDENAAV